MKYKHIVFDIDGTLIDTEYAVLHSLQETIKELSGRKIPCSELRFALGITGTDALKKLEIKDTSYAIELWDKNMRNYTNTIKVFDGIIELLKNLLSLDYKMGIVTSKTREEFTHDFCPFGISHYFKTIICAGENSVIGAGSVVTRPIPPNCVAVGNPCRVIRYFDTDREWWQHEVIGEL